MRLPFGFEIVRRSTQVVNGRGGWHQIIREPFAGAWQRNREITADSVAAFHAVYACVTLIANDIGKLKMRLVENRGGIWRATSNPAYSPVLRKPNRYQNAIQFKQWWVTSKLLRGNAYALKVRDNRNVVTGLYLLDPARVQVLVGEDGSVFYRLHEDNLSALSADDVAEAVPASEIIHDRMNCLFHPLVGVPPIYASGLAAGVGLNIEENAKAFFGNASMPSGLLIAPAPIKPETAARLKEQWDANYGGQNAGKVAVMGDGLKFEPMRMSAADAQMIEHLKWTAETVCSTFHVPPFKLGLGQMPTFQNGETLNQIYYSDCLQAHIEEFEAAMDEGLGLDGETIGVELDLDGLLRMDTATQIKTLSEGVGGGILSPNEARAKVDLPAVPGGASPYLQQQNYSLAALDERDRNQPFEKPPAPEPPPNDAPDDGDDGDVERALDFWSQKRADVKRRLAA